MHRQELQRSRYGTSTVDPPWLAMLSACSPGRRQLRLMISSPFLHRFQFSCRKISFKDLTGRQINAAFLPGKACMEMWGRVIVPKHHNENTVNDRQRWHPSQIQHQALRVLDRLLDAHQECHRLAPVDDAMVVGERQIHHRAHDHRSVARDRTLLDAVHAEDA
jgi:hypothetical protein